MTVTAKMPTGEKKVFKKGKWKTQENYHKRGFTKWQKRISINKKRVWIDKSFVPLIKTLNRFGLVTRSHCCGHGKNPSWVAIRSKNIEAIEVKNRGPYKELLIMWRKEMPCKD